ncbi:hypothetical protein EVB71_033 [Rhizobium phage RHph_Y55]|nr:hypothetical protein EVB71_033 [Rhizobium phage RHph_Y55]
MKDRDVHSAVVDWLAVKTGIVFIKDHGEGPRPELPYGMVNLLGVIEIRAHVSDILYEDVAVDEARASTVTENEWRFSCHVYGPEGISYLRPVRQAKHLSQQDEPLAPGLNVHEVSQIRNLPEFINNRWEPRAQMDLMIRGRLIEQVGNETFVIEHGSFTVASDVAEDTTTDF